MGWATTWRGASTVPLPYVLLLVSAGCGVVGCGRLPSWALSVLEVTLVALCCLNLLPATPL